MFLIDKAPLLSSKLFDEVVCHNQQHLRNDMRRTTEADVRAVQSQHKDKIVDLVELVQKENYSSKFDE